MIGADRRTIRVCNIAIRKTGLNTQAYRMRGYSGNPPFQARNSRTSGSSSRSRPDSGRRRNIPSKVRQRLRAT